MANADLTAQRVRELFNYDPETGIFTRRVKTAPKNQAGDVICAMHDLGYTCVNIRGRNYLCHRLAWLYVHGVWPTGDIDHINRIKTDNRIKNLRDVSRSVNMQNKSKARADSKTGVIGVQKSRGKWIARIVVDGKKIYLGCFDDTEAARLAYLRAKRAVHFGCTI